MSTSRMEKFFSQKNEEHRIEDRKASYLKWSCGPVKLPKIRARQAGVGLIQQGVFGPSSELADLATFITNTLAQSARITVLEARVDLLSRVSIAVDTYVTALTQPSLKLIKPIPVHIREQAREEFVASFFDAAVEANGETEAEAFRNLVDIVEGKFAILNAEAADGLGAEALHQLNVLKQFISSK